ncbi:MAG: decaprenyl-phosphate phosphoribosyltransferase [Clostridia bacterium]|nr:decaprenyl-phosphate phosphoribosyltransferase [Clostridia bacterium]
MKYLQLIRAKHYIKNLLIFLPLFFHGSLLDGERLLRTFFGFLVFCCVSSAVYIINDLRDLEKDRQHPVKSRRPLASGAVPPRQGILAAALLLAAAAGLSLFALPLPALVFPLLYLAANIAYSFGLKDQPLMDVTILSSGFVFRILYGGAIGGIEISNWLFMTVLTMALFFSLGKRRNEIRMNIGRETRAVLKGYPVSFLDKGMYMCLTLGNVFYALWTMDAATEMRYRSFPMIYSFPIVLLITLRYCLLVERESDGDPVEVILRDKTLLILCAVYVAALFVSRYL